MSHQFLLHGPANGTVRYEFTAFGHLAQHGCFDVEIEIASHDDHTETFTRKTRQHAFSTRVNQPQADTLTETCGPLTIVFKRLAGSRTALRQNGSRLFGLSLPRCILDVAATIKTSTDHTTLHSNVQITVCTIFSLRYAATLTERPTS